MVQRQHEFLRILGLAHEGMALDFYDQADASLLPLAGELLTCTALAQARLLGVQAHAATLESEDRPPRRASRREM